MLKLKETLKVLPLSQSPTGLLRTMTFTVSVFDIRTSLLIQIINGNPTRDPFFSARIKTCSHLPPSERRPLVNVD
jgi:hypothetical protein